MTDARDEIVSQWLANEAEEKVAGEVQVAQYPKRKDMSKITAVVTRRPGIPHNIVSLACLDRFAAGSWSQINLNRPQNGDIVKLKLFHSWFQVSFAFEFKVEETELCQIVLGSEALQTVDEEWIRSDGSICVIYPSMRKSAARGASVQESSQLAARTKQREQDRADEEKRRQAHRQTTSGSSGSDKSSGLSGSAGSRYSSTSTTK